MTPNAQHQGIESRAILPIADVMKLKLFTRFASLATITSTSERDMTNR
jgi:hypothetical protein